MAALIYTHTATDYGRRIEVRPADGGDPIATFALELTHELGQVEVTRRTGRMLPTQLPVQLIAAAARAAMAA